MGSRPPLTHRDAVSSAVDQAAKGVSVLPDDRHTQAPSPGFAPQESKLGDISLFIRKVAVKRRAVASVAPSGEPLCRAMTAQVDFSQPGVIVELGAGTGAITRAIIERLQPHHRFVAVEIDPDFVDILRNRFPRHDVVRADATRLEGTLRNIGIRRVKYVFSGLATPHLDLRGQINLHRWLHRMLDPTGAYIQITYVPRIYLRYYRRHFRDVAYTPIWRNIPPGGVFACRNIRPRVISKLAS
ncbi:MAG: methyltransferase domain-containing protein [Phycisphaerae bacterium]